MARLTFLGVSFFLAASYIMGIKHKAARGGRLLLGFRMYLSLARTDRVYLILAFSRIKRLKSAPLRGPFHPKSTPSAAPHEPRYVAVSKLHVRTGS